MFPEKNLSFETHDYSNRLLYWVHFKPNLNTDSVTESKYIMKHDQCVINIFKFSNSWKFKYLFGF